MSDSMFTESRATPAATSDGPSVLRLVGHYVGLFKRYFWVVLITGSVLGAAAYFWTQRQPRIYQTTSKIIFHVGDQNIFGQEIARVDLMDPGARWQFSQFWNTQKEILASQQFAQMVAKRSSLVNNETFLKRAANVTEEEHVERVAKRLRGTMSVSLKRDSRVANIQVTHTDPELAKYIADQYAKVYVAYTREFQSGGLNQMISWFDNYVAGKRKELDDSHKQLLEFQKNKGILAFSYESRQNLTAANMQTINTQLNDLNNRLAQQESLLKQIKLMEKGKEDLRTLVELMPSSTTLSSAISREDLLEERYAQLRGRGYMDDWREVKAVTEELEIVRKNIREDIERMRSGVRNKVQAMRRERSRLQNELDSLRKEIFKLNELGMEYTRMRDNTKSLQELFSAVVKRSEELDINSMYESRNIEVLEEARLPRSPVSPNLPINLAVGILLGIGLGAGIIVLIDVMDDTVKHEEDVTRYTDRPILGMLPHIDASFFKELVTTQGNPSDMLTAAAPKSSFAEGIKALRTNITFMASSSTPQVLTVTSPGPGEGKTMISSNISIAMAQSGLRTVIIDADLRRPRVHKAFGMENNEGLVDLLTAERDIADVVLESGVENLHVITSGAIPPNPSELLHGPAFQALVDKLRETYDRVIFDSPPMGAVSDPIIISRSVDGTLLVLMVGKTRRELLRRSIEQLVTVGAPLLGCVLNNINMNRGGYYGYSYYRYNYEDSPNPGS